MAAKKLKKPAKPVHPGRPERPAGPPPEFVTGDLGPVPAKPKPPQPVVVEAPAVVATSRAFSDPAPSAPEPDVPSVPGGPVHRAPCDPPSRT